MTLFTPRKIDPVLQTITHIESWLASDVQHKLLCIYGMDRMLDMYRYDYHEKEFDCIYEAMDTARHNVTPGFKKEEFVETMSLWLREAPDSDKVNRFFEGVVEELKTI